MPEEAKYLTLDGFLQYVMDSAKQDIRTVWRAILACGFDIHFERLDYNMNSLYEVWLNGHAWGHDKIHVCDV